MRVSEALDSGSIPDEATKPRHASAGVYFWEEASQARLGKPMSKNKPPAIEDCRRALSKSITIGSLPARSKGRQS